ncbi:Multicopper oxidase (plasmid) [Neorhizobium galegae bv. officinalis bv. officinalis str. HAMBI 1141]|uniref:Multicopper oxidase n=1 Tax=Neorhizobium galegae bv. officinalis bv. officinalis str. HAMBI 1141 TaxID=1028801 RepID=A0A068TK96_NEOGA|nr:multicopper oxidase domain-containing protein [Neorhizobium galegae]CDN57965.1 Multicopper oxidase [Neorhizobium galegae bv. officinalis bv. officinalis str. HAMBI 1141]
MYRREFLKTLAVGAAAVSPLLSASTGRADASSSDLVIGKRTLEVKGRPATVFGLTDRKGRPGLVWDAQTQFNLRLGNDTPEDTLIHWHGLTPPWAMDGVPGNPAALLKAKEIRDYDFPIGRGGTHWMHAHTLQEQALLAAPLIVRTAEDRSRDEQEIVVLLHDFSFKSPEELLAELKAGGSGHGNMPMGGQSMTPMMSKMHAQHQMPMSGGSSTAASMTGMQGMDLNDIEYDAYLANDRTLDDPEIVTVEKGGRVRLRIINGATATAFTIDTGSVTGSLIAVDGMEVVPVAGKRFPISMGQRLDIRLQLPSGSGTLPILALREGAGERTGIILATTGAPVTRLASVAPERGPVLDLALEQQLRGVEPLPARSPDHRYDLALTGGMAGYTWAIEAAEALNVSRGQRVRILMRNMSMMAHPMHLHGHHFQVVAVNGRTFAGAVRDTVLLPPMAEVAVEFDAENPGRWPLHCHHLYHMAAGMMSFITYDGAI